MSIHFHVIFRTCDIVESLHDAPRPFSLDKRTVIKICFLSLRQALQGHSHSIQVVGDRLSDGMLRFFGQFPVELTNDHLGNDGSIRRSAEMGLARPDDEWVYLCEDDYLHRPETFTFIAGLIEGRARVFRSELPGGIPSDRLLRRPLFIHPPDYPDRYLPRFRRPSLLFLSEHCHWRQIDRTTFTFLAQASSLKKFRKVLIRSSRGANDTLLSQGLFGPRFLGHPALCVSPIPGLSTHLHQTVMTPLVAWQDVCRRALAALEGTSQTRVP